MAPARLGHGARGAPGAWREVRAGMRGRMDARVPWSALALALVLTVSLEPHRISAAGTGKQAREQPGPQQPRQHGPLAGLRTVGRTLRRYLRRMPTSLRLRGGPKQGSEHEGYTVLDPLAAPASPLLSPYSSSSTEDFAYRDLLSPVDSTDATAPYAPPNPFPPSPNPLTPPPPAPAPAPGCPPSADACMFYFKGFEGTIPTLLVDGKASDKPISPVITTAIMGAAVVQVTHANSGPVNYVCQNGEYIPSDPPSIKVGLSSDAQFYATGDRVWQRTFQAGAGGTDPFMGKYVRLNFTSVALNMMNYVTNLTPGDNSQYFPEDKRCVQFIVG